MAVKLSVGLQKKVGQPDFGSLGASCNVEFEIDQGLLEHDLSGFHQKVAETFAACRDAVHAQLGQPQEIPDHSARNGNSADTTRHAQHARHTQHSSFGTGSGSSSGIGIGSDHQNGNGRIHGSGVASATQSQVRAIFAIARRNRVDPSQVVRERFQVTRPEDLSIREASSLIDELKQAASGGRS